MAKFRKASAILSEIKPKPMPPVGAFLRHLRVKFGLTQEFIAGKIGISRPTLNKIESGKADISLLQAKQLADFYNLPLHNLLTGQDSLQNQVRNALSQTEVSAMEGSMTNTSLEITRPEFRLELGMEVLLFLCSRMMAEPHFGEVNLKQLLFLIEITALKKLNYPFPGFVFLKNSEGPEPENWRELIAKAVESGLLAKIVHPRFKYPDLKYLPLRPARLDIFKATELRLMEEIMITAGQLETKELLELIENIEPYNRTELFKEISLTS